MYQIRVWPLTKFASTGRTFQNDHHGGPFLLDKRRPEAIGELRIVREIAEQSGHRLRGGRWRETGDDTTNEGSEVAWKRAGI